MEASTPLQALLPLRLGGLPSPLRSRLKSCSLLISLSILFRMVFSRASRLEDALVRLSWASESRWISPSSCERQTAEVKGGESSRGGGGCHQSPPPPQVHADLIALRSERGEGKT